MSFNDAFLFFAQTLKEEDKKTFINIFHAVGKNWDKIQTRDFKTIPYIDLLFIVTDYKNYDIAFYIQAQSELVYRFLNHNLIDRPDNGPPSDFGIIKKTYFDEEKGRYEEDINYDIFFIPDINIENKEDVSEDNFFIEDNFIKTVESHLPPF